MIKIERTETYGWEASVRGMRNAMESWDKSDSKFEVEEYNRELDIVESLPLICIGENDLALMKKLSKAGNDHAKYLRMINVTCDVTAPLYWWKEYDTYKVGTVANSCSTMHKIHAKEFTLDDFSHEHLDEFSIDHLKTFVLYLNSMREAFLETKNKHYWWQMIQLLPSSYNQKRTIQLNYQVLKNIYFARKNHKLNEWHDFCDWIIDLPYAKQIITLEE